MAAVLADVLRVSRPLFHEADPVGGQEADERMAGLALAGCAPQEAVAAVTCILDEAMTAVDRRHLVTEQAAGVPHFLGELCGVGERVGRGRERQRMSASNADILVNAVPIGQTHVGVMPEETGQRMANVRGLSRCRQVLDTATAAAHVIGGSAEHIVVDHVTPNPTAEPHP